MKMNSLPDIPLAMLSEAPDVDQQLAVKMKSKYLEHFQNLVRMHLSFALDLEEKDEQVEKMKPHFNKWIFGKKSKCSSKDAVDGNTLTDISIERMHRLISFLCREENIVQEGIFRKTGSLTRQLQLKTCLNEGVLVDFDENNFSVHDCASVLKNFLSDLPEPLVTDQYYTVYCQISEWCKCKEFDSRLLRSLQLLILLLPSKNALILQHVIHLLHLTAAHVEQNKMSTTNLATLFTPHILCPRKLSAEEFQFNAQMLYEIVVFMIEMDSELFKIPGGLAADIRLYWHDKEKKLLSPKNCMNESIADTSVVNTVFSFVDREKTAQENVTNPTETALAQLYAHIQSLPDSSKKRKLVKQFNKENGYGTPKRVHLNNNEKSNSITKNISDSLKKHIFHKTSAGKHEKNTKVSSKEKNNGAGNCDPTKSKNHSFKQLDCMECAYADSSEEIYPPKKRADEEDAEPEGFDENASNLSNNHFPAESSSFVVENASTNEQEVDAGVFQTPKAVKEVTKINSVQRKLTAGSALSSSHFYGTLTSTPAPISLQNNALTPSPFGHSNDEVSPITMSAQKMPKSMQEVMMTPRSRRPVLAMSTSHTNLSGKGRPDDNGDDTARILEIEAESGKIGREQPLQSCSTLSKNQTSLLSNQFDADSLTDTFRDYLYSRSIMTASIADDSFSSRTGDFDPSSMSEDKLSDSLLFCLDGGAPLENHSFPEDVASHHYDEESVHETLL